MLVLGKGLGNGLHIVALLIKGDVPKNELLAVDGGSGDIPISCAAACAIYEELLETNILEDVKEVSGYLNDSLNDLKQKYNFIFETRGKGLALAIELCGEGKTNLAIECVKKLYEKGFMVSRHEHSIVLRPPLSLTLEQANSFINVLNEIFKQMN